MGSDWRRKGLEFMLRVAQIMSRANVDVRVRVVGVKSSELPNSRFIEAAGFVDKREDSRRFCELVGSCDIGCLFSAHEAYGISILEFLRLGVPVAGFLHEGIADTIPPDAGFGFPPGTNADTVAGSLVEYARNAGLQASLRGRAREWAPLVTWDRCAWELESDLLGAPEATCVQPWRGLAATTNAAIASAER